MAAVVVLNRVLQQLRAHRALLEDAILALEQVALLAGAQQQAEPDVQPVSRPAAPPPRRAVKRRVAAS